VDKQVKPSDIVIMASGAVAIIFSFLPWFTAPEGLGSDINGWSTDLTFPLGTYIPIIGLILGGHVALSRFANVSFPERILGFSWPQIHLVLAIFAGLLALGWLIIDSGGADKGIGLWLSVLAAIGLVVGAVLEYVEGESAVAPGAAPPQPF
jgi:hypothetical protein